MHGTFQDWENSFIVEDRIISAVSSWLIRNQNLDGTFGESELYQRHPLNKKMQDRVSLQSTLQLTWEHQFSIHGFQHD